MEISNPIHQSDFRSNSTPSTSGVYVIVNQLNGKIYVGSAEHLLRRKRLHLRDLNGNKHHCLYLQNAWNKYGENNFHFVVVELVDIEKLVEREQWYLDHWPSDYNICKIAYSPRGVKRRPETLARMKESAQRGDNHWTRRKGFSVETLLKMSIARKKRCAEKGMPWTGKKFARERVEEMIRRRLKPVIQCDLAGNAIQEWPSATHAGAALSILSTNITRICKGKGLTTGGYKWKYAQKTPIGA